MSGRGRLAAALLMTALALVAPIRPAAAQVMASSEGVYLRGLDKVSGVTTDLAIAVGDSVQYGRMTITLIACRYPANDPAAEAYAFLEITDDLRNERLFRGWMVATAPALNALDHPRYDVWVMGCQ